jgi:acyl carrier protein
MSLPEAALAFLNENAKSAGVAQPKADDDLFKMGVLDSFSLIDFISILEEECGIKVPDADVNVVTFHSLDAISRYVEAQKG